MLLYVKSHIFNERPLDLNVLDLRKWNVDENGEYEEEISVGSWSVFTDTSVCVFVCARVCPKYICVSSRQ